MMQKGTLLRVKTKTFQDVFGEVIYEITEVGLPVLDADRKGQMDRVKCVIVGGSGPAARKGYTVFDSEFDIQRNIESGITSIVPADQRERVIAMFGDKAKASQKRCGNGVQELE